MSSKIWKKYEIIKEISSNKKIKTYLTKPKIEPVIKEIKPKNKEEYYLISERLQKIKELFKIYEIIEENGIFYVVLDDDDNETLSKIDKLILSEEFDTQKDGTIENQGNPITKDEIFKLMNLEKSMCKISYENMDNDKPEKEKGIGFFCEMDNSFPIKYALFTNNHILNKFNIEVGNTISFEYLEKSLFSKYKNAQKQIKITEKRKVVTNEELDYTCIEIFESDGIKDFFKVAPKIFKYNNKYLKNKDIFILQFLNENDISFSYGKIKSVKDNKIFHNAATESGSPIIRKGEDNYVIGLHFDGIQNNKNENKKLFNSATTFNTILDDISEQLNSITCTYIVNKNESEINLMHDYSLEDISQFGEEFKQLYLEAKKLNKSLIKENIELYINNKNVEFDFKYKTNSSGEIKVKFKFKKILLTNTSFMFYNCPSLKSIDLSLFNTNNVNNMSYMFYKCSSLTSINLSSFITSNVNNMDHMFSDCSSLMSLDLSSFNTSNVNNMNYMFFGCSSLKSIDLSSFNTSNINNMSHMFYNCSSLKSLDLSSFNTININNMSHMFFNCSSLLSILLSSFNTSNVNNMSYMFFGCSSLKSIDLSSFNTSNVNNMSYMLYNCSSLTSLDISSFNTSNVNNVNHMFFGCSSLNIKNLKMNKKDYNHLKKFDAFK